jgi:signal transduction histidine kinase/CheY-like chemotaxis protein/HPt (histidine-containing phosphotransfer) domain-containing protein
MQDIYITDLIEVELLQKIQDSFSEMTGMAALTTDDQGIPVTRGSGFTDYCMKYTRSCAKGHERCEQCDRLGAEATMVTGKAVAYECHSGLMDFAAPIKVEGKLVGCFIGGQVLAEFPKKEFIYAIAKDLGISPELYWKAIQSVSVVPRDRIDAAADFLYVMADVLSSVAYSRYRAIEDSKEVEHAANMKTDFLANMSHEIRTPMNGVIGMAEIALREDLTPAARDCITQIKSSGMALLNIINDILDFSKIEAGKMDIAPVEYHIMSLLHDVANIIMTRIKDKEVELLMSINPKIPAWLEGDNLRIRQILINIANNSAKFTRRGKVVIDVDYETIDSETIMLKFAVQDTGIGMKQEDLKKLFTSFQQLDSKRNRNVEGTGLGLAISKNLLTLMNGDINVKSEYEKGSTFTFQLPQKVISSTPSISVTDADKKAIIGFLGNVFMSKELYADAERLEVTAVPLKTVDKMEELLQNNAKVLEDKHLYIFVDEANFEEHLEPFMEKYPDITVVMVTDFSSTRKSTLPNLKIMRKPLSTLSIALALNGKDRHITSERESMEFDFTAPDAEILIVDDNEVNLTVVEGLIAPLKMHITKATSGKMALELIAKKRFDIIFMDHMMPELDGVETTRIIRRLHPSYDDIPIIALTANAIEGVKDVFLREGMNDFVAKPIEMRTFVKTIRKWLPESKIKTGFVSVENEDDDEDIEIADLDTESAIELLGNKKLYWSILKEYYRAIPTKSVRIKELESNGDYENYTIEVHALKSGSRQIGAMELGDMAAALEQAGHDGDIKTIKANTDIMLQKYVTYIDLLKPYCEDKEEKSDKLMSDKVKLEDLFNQMLGAVDELDIDRMEEVMVSMERYDYPDNQQEYFKELQVAVGNIDVDLCEEIISKWREML